MKLIESRLQIRIKFVMFEARFTPEPCYTATVQNRLIEQRYLGIARYEKATAVKEKGRNISRGAAPNVTVLLEK